MSRMADIIVRLQYLRLKERAALAGLLRYVDSITCTHESTHRSGAIWTICDDCEMKRADDRGGFKPYKDAPEVRKARAALSSQPEVGET